MRFLSFDQSEEKGDWLDTHVLFAKLLLNHPIQDLYF